MKANNNDIVISSRVRLARNIADYPFPCRISAEKAKELCSAAGEVLESAGYKLTDMSGVSRRDAAAMVERHIISPEFASGTLPRALVSSEDGMVNVMINEEDHLRIQAIAPGLCLEECLDRVMATDDILEAKLRYAFSEQLGYLTQCPTNIGTGIRASAMLHLPALTASGEIRSLISAVSKLGFAVRGIYGEGSEAVGAIYQISNQLTLGFSEVEIIDRLEKAVESIIGKERALREQDKKRNPNRFSDTAHRALGILATARTISNREAMSLLSDLRVGVSLGEIGSISYETINNLLWEIQPNSMAAAVKSSASSERDLARAELLRRSVREAILNEI